MPRHDINRDAFVAQIDRRNRIARVRARAFGAVGALRKPFQAAVYDATFRTDDEAVSYSYALRNDHLPDLDTPVWLNEKIRWQFLHHRNPLMSLAADKVAVRAYLKFKKAVVEAPKLLATGTDPKALVSMDLPARFMLKSNHGSGQNHKEDGSVPTPGTALAKRVAAWNEFDQWRRTGELHYRGIPKRWLIEELLPTGIKDLEFQVLCLHGVPQFISVITERLGKGPGNLKQVNMDPEWQPLDLAVRGLPNDRRPVPRPKALDLVLAEARRLSEDFMLVRVDFLQFGDRLVFSELTFADSAARVPFEPLERNVELGARMNLSRAPEYLARGQRIAAELDWNQPAERQVETKFAGVLSEKPGLRRAGGAV